MNRGRCLIVFTKAPVPGAVKTRLIPALGTHGAARLHSRLLERTLDTARALEHCRIELHVGPNATHPAISDLATRAPIVLRSQCGTDLGARMRRALSMALESASRAVLVGTDCPGLSTAMLEEALGALEGNDAVLGPALDGGYFLIGTHQPVRTLFHDIPWGTAQVLSMTRRRLRTLGWRWHELQPLRDLDRPEDLPYFPDLFDATEEEPLTHGLA